MQAVAEALATSGRRGEGVYRYGGEEFLHVLPEQPQAAALAALERFRSTVEQLAIPHATAPAGVLTVSVGIATYVPGHTSNTAELTGTGEALLQQADIALYQAKAAGRNTVSPAAAELPRSDDSEQGRPQAASGLPPEGRILQDDRRQPAQAWPWSRR